MHSEHKLIGLLILGLLVVLFPVGVYIAKRCFDILSPTTLRRAPLIYVVIFSLGGVAEYYTSNFLTNGKSGIRQTVIETVTIFAMFMLGWLLSYTPRRRKLASR